MDYIKAAKNNLIRAATKALKNDNYQTVRAVLTALEDLTRLTVSPPELTESERHWIRNNQKVDAIKSVRARTGLGLAEAKDVVEAELTKPNVVRNS